MSSVLTINKIMADKQKRNITKIINDYSKRLLIFISKRVTNEADAEDILQDVFYQLIGNTQPIEQLTAWLFAVARNKIIDKSRKHKPELIDDLFTSDDETFIDWTDFFADANNNPEKELIKNIFWETLNEALDELPKEQRNVFIMHELEDFSFKDISAKTGDSINTLLARKRYAVLYLRKRLQTLRNELINY